MTHSHQWKLQADEYGNLQLADNSGILLQFAPAICLDRTYSLEDQLSFIERRGDDLIYQVNDRIELRLRITLAEQGARLETSIKNLSDAPLPVQWIAPLSGCRISSPTALDRFLVNGSDMNGQSDLVVADREYVSYSVVGLSSRSGDAALVAGFDSLKDAAYLFELAPNELTAKCDREGLPLLPGNEITTSALMVSSGPSLTGLMEAYADRLAAKMNARKSPVKAGWCSWYTYYGTETLDEVVANVDSLSKWKKGSEIDIIQIDDGWSLPVPGAPRNWGDWLPGKKFEKGMKSIVDEIKARGYEAGLWLAPFSVDPASNLYKDHPEWLVQDEDGPKPFWGVYGLDLTNPEAIEHIKTVFRRVFDEWDFSYVKIDFLIHAVQLGIRKDNSLTTVEVFRRGIEAIREVAGDRYILNCGSLKGPSVGVCDAMRIGPDVSHRWYIPLNLETWPVGNCSIYSGAVHTIWRQWMHGRLWQNDPDCLLVHEDGTTGEKEMFDKEFDRQFAEKPSWGLTDEEAGLWVRLIWMTGGLAMIGEDVGVLSEKRSDLLAQAFPPSENGARVVDSYENPRVVALISGGEVVRIGVFNLTDTEQTLDISTEKLGLGATWSFRERINGETFNGEGSIVGFPVLAPRSGRIWELQE